MNTQIDSILDRLGKHLPPVLPLTEFDKHPALPRAKTVRNLRATRSIPSELFVRDGRRVLVDVPAFLDWWGRRLRPEALH